MTFLYEPYTTVTLFKQIGRTVCVSHEAREACNIAKLRHTLKSNKGNLRDGQAIIALKCDQRIMKGYLMGIRGNKATSPYEGYGNPSLHITSHITGLMKQWCSHIFCQLAWICIAHICRPGYGSEFSLQLVNASITKPTHFETHFIQNPVWSIYLLPQIWGGRFIYYLKFVVVDASTTSNLWW
jgi:hypothetical protein